jgi:hypothetical protein
VIFVAVTGNPSLGSCIYLVEDERMKGGLGCRDCGGKMKYSRTLTALGLIFFWLLPTVLAYADLQVINSQINVDAKRAIRI